MERERPRHSTPTTGTASSAILRNVKDVAALHSIDLPESIRYSIRLINGDNLGVNKIVELVDTPELLYCIALNKGKEAIFVVNKARINYISIYSKEYTEAYNKNKGFNNER